MTDHRIPNRKTRCWKYRFWQFFTTTNIFDSFTFVFKSYDCQKLSFTCYVRWLVELESKVSIFFSTLDKKSSMSCDVSTRLNLEFFAEFQSIYLFIPRFLAEPLTMFCGTLVGKLWLKVTTPEASWASESYNSADESNMNSSHNQNNHIM
jgi:hypothetical protein